MVHIGTDSHLANPSACALIYQPHIHLGCELIIFFVREKKFNFEIEISLKWELEN